MLQPVNDYSFESIVPSAQVQSPKMRKPSAPEYCPPKKYESSSNADYELTDFNAELESYVHIEQSDLASYLPNASPPNYPCPKYTPYQSRNYQELSLESPAAEHNLYALPKNCVEKITKIFKQILYYAIEGVHSSDYVPSFLAIWMPEAIESTESRRNRYLRESRGDQNEATDRCIERNHTKMRQFKVSGIETIPYLGTASAHSLNLWHQLREITLIAAIHGHDVRQDDVQAKIFSCLIGGNIFKLAGLSTDFVIYEIVKNMILNCGIKDRVTKIIPLNVIFNFFTNDTARVSGHAKRVFGRGNSRPVSGYS